MEKDITNNICANITKEMEDRARWMGAPSEKISVKSLWEYIRNKREVKEIY